jgi:DNA-binding SARP family transcriptional activator
MSTEVAAECTPRVCIHAFGGLEILVDGQSLRFARRAPVRCLQLLGVLIAHGGRGVGSGSLADALWPDAEGDDAFACFTITLHRLRRMLTVPRAVVLSAGQVSLDRALCRVDVWEFEHALRQARDAKALRDALASYHGPFLGDSDQCWAIAARQRLAQLAARAHRELERLNTAGSVAGQVQNKSLAFVMQIT